jgi:hypothetical protein
MNLADHSHAVLGFGIVDGVAAGDEKPAGFGDVLAPEENIAQEFVGKFLGVPTNKVEGDQRRAPHGVDVGYCVGCGHATPSTSIVNHWCDEVGGDDKRAFGRQAIDGRVVTTRRADEQVWRIWGSEAAHDLRQFAGGEFAASTSAVAELGKSLRHRFSNPLSVAGHGGRDRGTDSGPGHTRS